MTILVRSRAYQLKIVHKSHLGAHMLSKSAESLPAVSLFRGAETGLQRVRGSSHKALSTDPHMVYEVGLGRFGTEAEDSFHIRLFKVSSEARLHISDPMCRSFCTFCPEHQFSFEV